MRPKLNRALADVLARADDMLLARAEDIASEARDIIHSNRSDERRLPSPLADSIHVEREGPGKARVGVRAAHAPFVEFGTTTQDPEPFLTPAVEQVVARRNSE